MTETTTTTAPCNSAEPSTQSKDEAQAKVNEEINAKINDVVKDMLDDATARDDDSSSSCSSSTSSNDPAATTEDVEVDPATAKKIAEYMALNEAFIAMESMRKANLEEEYRMATKDLVERAKIDNSNKTDLVLPDLHEFCTGCLRQHRQDDRAFAVYQQQQALHNQNATYHQAQHQLLTSARQKRRQRQWRVKSPPCLICAAPVCKKHADRAYHKEKIQLCQECAPLFQRTTPQTKQDIYQHGLQQPNNRPQPAFVMTQTLLSRDTTPAQRQRLVGHMMDAYDRARLLLRYSCQSSVLDVLLDDLEDTKHTHNHVNLGSSGLGLLSGITGMGAVGAQAAAAVGALTILSPAGPPLLIASILLGGSAAVATSSTEACAHFSHANQLANRILSLHTLLVNLSVMVEELKDDSSTRKSLPSPPSLSTTHPEDDDDASVEEVFQDEPVPTITIPKDSTSKDGISFDSQETADMSDETTEANEEDTPVDQEVVPEEDESRPPTTASPEAYAMDGIDVDDDDDDDEGNNDVVAEESSTKPSTGAVTLEDLAESVNGDASEEGNEKEDEKEVTEIPAQRSAAVRAAMPLVPLVDDAALGFFQMLSASGPTGNARVALSRAGTNAMKVAQFASVACGALCAATIYMEVKNLNNTLNSLRAGSPCDKAQKLRKIRDELGMFPETHVMAAELKASLPDEEQDKAVKAEVVEVATEDKAAENVTVAEELLRVVE